MLWVPFLANGIFTLQWPSDTLPGIKELIRSVSALSDITQVEALIFLMQICIEGSQAQWKQNIGEHRQA